MTILNENNFEQELIEKISNLPGFRYETQKRIIELRKDLNSVVLDSVLLSSIKKINNNISNEHINSVYRQLIDLLESNTIMGNKEFQRKIIHGIKIYDYKLKKTITYKIIDDVNVLNNDFIVTNQFRMESQHFNYKYQYPDVVIYMNGLPIIVFELKGFDERNTLESAYNQITNYKKFLPKLFTYNFFIVIAEPVNIKFGSLTATQDRYQYWKGSEYNSSPNNLITDLLNPEHLIDLVKNFTFYQDTKKDIKIVASYHQYYGVKKAIKRTIEEIEKEKSINGRAGIFWHTQGSGKSFSMLFLVKQITKQKPKTTFLIVTDRNDLDNQLYKTFKNAEKFISQQLHQVKSIKNLVSSLKDKQQDGVFFSTIQKFTKDVGLLSNRDDILIISDEAHRSHNNIYERIKKDEKSGEIVKKQGNALHLRNAFPKATFIGFTGTPISKDDKSTEEIFGEYIDKYLMTNAENDGVVVPIRYESRKPELNFDQEQMDILVNEHSKITEEINKNSNLSDEMIKKINKAIQKLENFIIDPDRVKGIVNDFIFHYESRVNILEGRIMFVTFNRFVAFEYYKLILKLKPEWKNNVKLIITTNQQQDPSELLKAAGGPEDRKRRAEEFKKVDSEFKIAIVVDMWLTGFDVPSLDVIYIDKPLKMHNLMQAIARTNRVFTNEKTKKTKEHGLVVDYIGLWYKLTDALAFYSGNTNKKITKDINLLKLKEKYLINIEKIYEKFGFNKLINKNEFSKQSTKDLRETLDLLLNKIYKDKLKNDFIHNTKNIRKNLNEVISILNEVEKLEFEMLLMVRSQIIKTELGEFDLKSKENILIRQLAKTIKFEKTDIISEIEANPIFLSQIIKQLQQPSPKGKEELYAKLNGDITKKLIDYSNRKNFLKAQDLRKKLEKIMKDYDNNYISLEKLMETFKTIQNEILNLNSSELNDLGYTEEEQAFYDMILKPVKDTKFDEEIIKKITDELLKIINDDKKVNKSWIFDNHLISRVKREIKILMSKYNYPPKPAKETTEEIIEQIMYQKNLKGNN